MLFLTSWVLVNAHLSVEAWHPLSTSGGLPSRRLTSLCLENRKGQGK